MASDQFIVNRNWIIDTIGNLLRNNTIGISLWPGFYITERIKEAAADGDAMYVDILKQQFPEVDITAAKTNGEGWKYLNYIGRGGVSFIACVNELQYVLETICLMGGGTHFWISSERFFEYIQGPMYSLNITNSLRHHLDRKFTTLLENGVAKYMFEKYGFSPSATGMWPILDKQMLDQCIVLNLDQLEQYIGIDVNTGNLSFVNLSSFFKFMCVLCTICVGVLLWERTVWTVRKSVARKREKLFIKRVRQVQGLKRFELKRNQEKI